MGNASGKTYKKKHKCEKDSVASGKIIIRSFKHCKWIPNQIKSNAAIQITGSLSRTSLLQIKLQCKGRFTYTYIIL